MRLDASVLLGERIENLGNAVSYVITYYVSDEQAGYENTYNRINQQTVVLLADKQMARYEAVDY